MTDSFKYKIFSRDFFTCQQCGYSGDVARLTVAHRIKQGTKAKNNQTINFLIQFIWDEFGEDITKKKATEIMHHDFNVTTACRGSCNDSFNIFHKPIQRDELIKNIWEDIKKDEGNGIRAKC